LRDFAGSNVMRVADFVTSNKRSAASKEAGWALGTPFVIFGGIYGGVFTPTEAAGVAVVYSIVVTMFIYRDIGWRDLWRITLGSVFLISQILIIVTAAGIYSWLLTTSGIPRNIVATMISLHLPLWQVLLMVNLGLLLIGSFLEPPAAIMILTRCCCRWCRQRAYMPSTLASSWRSISRSECTRRHSG
jgi:TRAP-type C4-dicarboxylate transport system permease large subunit